MKLSSSRSGGSGGGWDDTEWEPLEDGRKFYIGTEFILKTLESLCKIAINPTLLGKTWKIASFS